MSDSTDGGQSQAGLTVISYSTPDFRGFLDGLSQDCRRLGYRLHHHECDQVFDKVIAAFDYKIGFIREAIIEWGRVLWVDIECRIDRPIPSTWNPPLISCYDSGTSAGFSSGVLLLDREQLWLVELWEKYARKYPQFPDDFVLDFLATQVDLPFATVPFEFYDRDTLCPIARGEWTNDHTIVRHPTVNRWPRPLVYRRAFRGKQRERHAERELISRQRKGIFFRNFAGDFDEIEALFGTTGETIVTRQGWVFDTQMREYAPEMYWPDLKDDFTVKPRTFEASREQFFQASSRRSFREKAMSRMKLDREDRRRFGQKKGS